MTTKDAIENDKPFSKKSKKTKTSLRGGDPNDVKSSLIPSCLERLFVGLHVFYYA